MIFDIGTFYKYTYTDVAGKHIEFFYCTDIENENEGIDYAPFWEVRLHNISGEGMEILCDENGYAKEYAGVFEKISSEEFAKALLEATIEGRAYLSDTAGKYRLWKAGRKESRIDLPDFGLGNDEE